MAKTRNSLGFPLKERNLLKTSAADRIMVYYFKGFFFSPKSWTPIGVFFLRGKSGWYVMLTCHLHLALRLRMSTATPLLPLHAFAAYTG